MAIACRFFSGSIGLGAIVAASSGALVARDAAALDPGVAQGTLRVGREAVALTHAYAHLHDNAEGLLGRTPELRILVTDRELSPSVLFGQAFLPVDHLAMEGGVRGVLLELDPKKPNDVLVTYLQEPEPGYSLRTETLYAEGSPLWEEFEYGTGSVSGRMAQGNVDRPADDPVDAPSAFEDMAFSFDFRAPLFHEPAVTSDVSGEEAKRSPQVEALRARIAALETGDFAAVAALSTDDSVRRIERYLEASGTSREDFMQMMKAYAAEARVQLNDVRRVVVRGDRAVVIFAVDEGAQWATLELVDGVWKSAD